MSTGLDCYFEEKQPGEWYLFLEEEYGHKLDIVYDKFGPFITFTEAREFLDYNFANPGGWGVHPHKDSIDKSWEF